jgi:hypothetical protein
MKNDAVEEGIWSVDFDFLLPNIVESIMNSLPSEAEEKVLKQFVGVVEELSNADRYLLTMISVKGYANRIKSMKFMNQYSIMEKDIYQRITSLHHVF